MDLGTIVRLLQVPALVALLTAVEFFLPFRLQSRTASGRLATNLTLMLTTLATLLVFNTLLVMGAAYINKQDYGLLPTLGIGGTVAIIVGVIALDFATYIAHVFLHKSAWGWRVHKVHHSDAAVDATTTLRQHPIEHAVRFAFSFGTAALLGLPLAAVAVAKSLSGINAVLEHANIRVPRWLDRSLVWFWVTPDMHKIHHSCVQSETDSNYANLLSLFDRCFGTYAPSRRAATVRYGLQGYDSAQCQSVAGVLAMPFVSAVSAAAVGATGEDVTPAPQNVT
jgi:sterol desaturase/sphingolipid hydroxylase (fatty acid hydroxylase superfamily)